MADARWERLAAATGIVFVAMGVAAFLIGGQPPKADDSAEKVVAYFTEDRNALLTSSYLFGLAGVFFLWFLGSLRSHLRRAEGDSGRLSAVVFGAGLLTGAFFTVGSGAFTALAFRVAGQTSSDVSLAFYDLGAQITNFAAFGVVAFAGATAILVARTGAFPQWIGWLSWLVVLAALAGSVALFADSGPFATGGAVSSIGFGLFFLWFLALSITLMQKVGRGAAARS
ncbi:MAG: hypothetical protein ACRDHM_02415 [Actinomycetota bacterium]